jgi:hypothetical protein
MSVWSHRNAQKNEGTDAIQIDPDEEYAEIGDVNIPSTVVMRKNLV